MTLRYRIKLKKEMIVKPKNKTMKNKIEKKY
jgi:hypothetical protein